MQTFLPYADFVQSASVLDRQRCGKQRVEVLQIANVLIKQLTGLPVKGWANHPAVTMWRGYEIALLDYGIAMCDEWAGRGYTDNLKTRFQDMQENLILDGLAEEDVLPPWLGDPEFHRSHRSNLLRKNPEFYLQFGWNEPHDLEYVWPVALDTALATV